MLSEIYFWLVLIGIVVAGIKVVAQLPCPGALRLDVARQEVLMRRRGQGETVELICSKRRARQSHPLAREVLEIGWPVEFDLDDVRWQQFSF